MSFNSIRGNGLIQPMASLLIGFIFSAQQLDIIPYQPIRASTACRQCTLELVVQLFRFPATNPHSIANM
jgi:hypothetical protein